MNEIGEGTICTPCTQLIAQPGKSGLTLGNRMLLPLLHSQVLKKVAFVFFGVCSSYIQKEYFKGEHKTILQSNNMVALRVIYLHLRYGMVQYV